MAELGREQWRHRVFDDLLNKEYGPDDPGYGGLEIPEAAQDQIDYESKQERPADGYPEYGFAHAALPLSSLSDGVSPK